MYNMMTCQGGTWVQGAMLGGCSMAWLSLTIVVFIAMMIRRQCDDGILAGVGFNPIGAFAGGGVTHIVLTAIFGSARWSLLGGIAGVALGGFVLGLFLDGGGGEYA